MIKNFCQTYLKGLKEYHFKLFLALALASGATRPCLGASEHPLNPQAKLSIFNSKIIYQSVTSDTIKIVELTKLL